jgi:environmental stress-induced protein Ves
MSWQIVPLEDVSPAPWRNGGGVTRELLAWPTPQDWDWRISVAEVEKNGPFSRF